MPSVIAHVPCPSAMPALLGKLARAANVVLQVDDPMGWAAPVLEVF